MYQQLNPRVYRIGGLVIKIKERGNNTWQEYQGIQTLQAKPFFRVPRMTRMPFPGRTILVSRYVGEPLPGFLQVNPRSPYLGYALTRLGVWVAQEERYVSAETCRINPYQKSLKTIDTLKKYLDCDDKVIPLLKRSYNFISVQEQIKIRAFQGHGDLHLGNILVDKDGELYLIDPRVGIYPIFYPLVKMIYFWYLLYGRSDYPQDTHIIRDKILATADRLDCLQEVVFFLIPTMLRVLYPEALLEEKFYDLAVSKSCWIDQEMREIYDRHL